MTMADADGNGKEELLVGSDDFEVKQSQKNIRKSR